MRDRICCARALEPGPGVIAEPAYRLHAFIFLHNLDFGADKLGRMLRLQSLGGGATSIE